MVEHQGPRRHAACQIVVDNVDVTDRVNPYLISVQVIDSWEFGADQCNLELDDRNAQLQIPPDGSRIQVLLGWAGEGPRVLDVGREKNPNLMTSAELLKELPFGGPGMRLVFDGWVSNVESGFGRHGGGRRMWIEATGYDFKGDVKSQQQKHYGEGNQDDSQPQQASDTSSSSSGGGGGGGGGGQIPLTQVMTDIFGMAGLTARLSPEMQKLKRNYWHVNESPMNFGQRIAREVGGRFKISGGVATLVGATEGVNADGEDMPTVEAIWGANLIGWRIRPYAGRPQFEKAETKHFDIFNAAWKVAEGAIGGNTPFGNASAIVRTVASQVDQNNSEQNNEGQTKDSLTKRGHGWILMNGEPNAKAGGSVHISGARPGVDGTYSISEVEHNYTRQVGFTTRLNVQYPIVDEGGFAWKYKLKPKEAPKEESKTSSTTTTTAPEQPINI